MKRTTTPRSSSLLPRPSSLFVGRATQLGALAAAAALALVVWLPGGCSLGEGVTPAACDPNLPANTDGACTQSAACDDGKGGILPLQDCCVNAAATFMGLCLQDGVGNDWPQNCTSGGFLVQRECTFSHSDVTDVAKMIDGFNFSDQTTGCELGQAVLDFCLAGGLEYQDNTGGGGTGGSPGGGGSGGSPGGGSGGSAGGAGGAGGN